MGREMQRLSDRILVVDDEEGAVETLGYILEAAGFSVRLAINGKTAMAALEQERFALVLLDIVMPDADGLEMCRLIRRRFPETSVVLMTGYYADDAFDEISAMPGVYLLHKPLPMPRLLELCQRLGPTQDGLHAHIA